MADRNRELCSTMGSNRKLCSMRDKNGELVADRWSHVEGGLMP